MAKGKSVILILYLKRGCLLSWSWALILILKNCIEILFALIPQFWAAFTFCPLPAHCGPQHGATGDRSLVKHHCLIFFAQTLLVLTPCNDMGVNLGVRTDAEDPSCSKTLAAL